MKILTKALLISAYPLALGIWLVNRAARRDPLRLRDAEKEKSYWIARRAQPTIQSYFSEESCAEGDAAPTATKFLTRLLRRLARLYMPPRQISGPTYKAAAEREQGIPDEVYTLW